MKVHSNGFKQQIKLMGKEIDSKITIGSTVLGKNELNAVTPSFQGAILKSVMKQLDIDSNIEIPLNSVLNYKFGVKVNGEYEYIDFGNYVVYKSEKQEDTNSYKITCYDKMLYSMKDYENMNITYPITIRDYISKICEHLGLIFANANDIFANYDKEIPNELYLNSDNESMGFTFRDVLDQLSEVTASTICINDNDELEIRYITETADVIDEEYLKDVNVNFGEKYGPVNSIVLSRSGESDNVYLQDEASISVNGLTELKIIDNEIMNFNNRDEYLPEILGKLNGLEYYLNDYSSTGITYYDVCDRYNVKIGDNIYSCVMFNDEINVTQGLEENVFTEIPDKTETDYTKADKTDRKINQTYLIVDKQNQVIESVISQTDSQNQKIAQVTQTVEELNSKISDIADITTSAEDDDAQVEFEKINQSEPIRIVIRPIGENISYLYPNNNLYPSNDLYSKNRKIRFENITTGELIDYELPADLLYYDSENYDEFILDYDGQSCVINKKVGYNADGTTYVLDNIQTIEYEYPQINLTDGDYKVYVLGYENAYIFVRLMTQNIYTTQFYTKAETNSLINQTAQSINLNVNQKLSNYSTTKEMNSAIQLTANEINQTVSQKIGKNEVISSINNAIVDGQGIINLKSNSVVIDSDNFKLTASGQATMNSANITGGLINVSAPYSKSVIKLINENNNNEYVALSPRNSRFYNIDGQSYLEISNNGVGSPTLRTKSNSYESILSPASLSVSDGNTSSLMNWSEIITPILIQTSKEETKKNFELFENALEIIKKIDIYKYNLKYENDNQKKHIGIVIGENYNYSSEITSLNKDGEEIGIDNYSMTSLCLQAIKEQQIIINKLEEKIKKIEGVN